ncbi:MAG: hypothetical protein KY475_22150 [Planctomycetes bacterium]|nr:hypothetical protein [Planctomycetota bacterium]
MVVLKNTKQSTIPLQEFIEFMIIRDEPGLVEAVQCAVIEEAVRRGISRDNFLGGLRRKYYDALDLTERCVKQPHKLVECLSRLQIPIESLVSTDFRLPPWDRFRSGSTVMVVMGEKYYRDKWTWQRAVGVHDMQAQTILFKTLNEVLQLRFKVEEYMIPIDSTPEEAEDDFRRLLKERSDVGMVVTIGAPVVNAMVEPLAKTVFERAGIQEPPIQFQWSFDLRDADKIQLPEHPVLTIPEAGEEGIFTRRGTFLPRMSKRQVVQEARKGNLGPYPCCGMLLMDVTREPFLVAAAGHSGCSTMAACVALGCMEEVYEMLEQSKTPDSPLGENQLLALLQVDRRKHKDTDPELDDLYFRTDQGTDWRFFNDA